MDILQINVTMGHVISYLHGGPHQREGHNWPHKIKLILLTKNGMSLMRGSSANISSTVSFLQPSKVIGSPTTLVLILALTIMKMLSDILKSHLNE